MEFINCFVELRHIAFALLTVLLLIFSVMCCDLRQMAMCVPSSGTYTITTMVCAHGLGSIHTTMLHTSQISATSQRHWT